MADILDYCVAEQEKTSTEGNTLYSLLRMFLGYRAKTISEGNWQMSASELRLELLTVCDKLRMELPWQTAEKLAHAIKREPTMFQRLGLQRVENRATKTFRYVFTPTAVALADAKAEWSRLTEPWDLDEVPDRELKLVKSA